MTENVKPQKVCAVSNCDRTHYAKGLCVRHYQQMRRGNKTPGQVIAHPNDRETASKNLQCQATNCQRTRVTSRYCWLHEQRLRTKGTVELGPKQQKVCSVDGCSNNARTRGMCNKHYQKWFRDHSDENGKLIAS